MDIITNGGLRQYSTTVKMFVVGVLMFICLVPSLLVLVVLEERTSRQEEAKSEITEKWGKNQVIAGPILSLPYTKTFFDSQGIRRETTGVLNVLPQKLSYAATIEPEVRSRGIFEAVVYKTKVDGSGTFAAPDLTRASIAVGDIEWDKAYITIGISDTRGVVRQLSLSWAGSEIPFGPGAKNTVAGDSGIHAFVPIEFSKRLYDFSYSFDLQGSEELAFLPLGGETTVGMKSNWESPSFIGTYLPNERTVNDGFSANWLVSSFGRSYPQQWIDSEISRETLHNSSFGVSLNQDVDFYTKINRTIKYAIMFIAITFIAFFLFEVLSKLKIHPFQYLLVGLALALFYLLLLSFSERFGFLTAYVISTLAIIGLITSYSAKVLKAQRKAITIAGLLVLLYSYLYVIVQLEDLALLYGSILLFFLLALTMYLTRNIDWYQVDREGKV